uniref:RNA helicase n=1 Tax=Mandrillus leucophaeus TaxID=9568 RepID=A0A2K5XXX9_MANLE
MLGRLHSNAGLESDTTMKKQTEKKEKRETEETAEEEETVSPKAKQVKKKTEPSEIDMNYPKSKKAKKKEEPSQDDISPKTKSLRKKKEPIEKKAVSSKTKKVIKNEEPSEEETDAPKPKKMKKEKEINGETGEKSPKLKNGFPHSEPDCDPNKAANEESNSETEQEIPVKQKEGLTFLFSIQAKTFHHVYSRKDLIAQAWRGTGKTLSFAIPLIEKLHGELQDRKRGRPPQVLVLAPTRELANQVSKDFSDITKRLSVACFYGGTPYGGQFECMGNGIGILVGTPGPIKDRIQNVKLDLTKLKHVVLDEVDQMLDMGFADQVEEILNSENGKNYRASEGSNYWVIRVYSGHQGRTIIFRETKKEAQELSQNSAIKQDAQSLHGDIPQKQREITLKGFRNGSFGVLVATDVVARGLDIPEVHLVIQSSPPKDVESYIHRSGWTGRAGRTGVCICFYQHKEEYQLQKVGIKFKRIGVPSATEIKVSSKDAIRLSDSMPPTAISHFKQSAEKLIEEKGAVEALAATLAHISGAMSVDQRSLINSNVGFVTMILRCSIEMPNISYAWKELKREIDSKVKGMVFLKGKLGVCFDVSTTSATEIQEKWHDSPRWQLSVATEQLELEGPREGYGGFRGSRGFREQRDGNRRFRGQREGNRGPRGQQPGGSNKSDRSQNKGQKRSFSKAFGQ